MSRKNKFEKNYLAGPGECQIGWNLGRRTWEAVCTCGQFPGNIQGKKILKSFVIFFVGFKREFRGDASSFFLTYIFHCDLISLFIVFVFPSCFPWHNPLKSNQICNYMSKPYLYDLKRKCYNFSMYFN